jgi:hypothetical protein
MSNHMRHTLVAVLAVAALGAASCTKEQGGAPPGGDNGNVTSANPAGATTPSSTSSTKTPAQVLPVPSGTNPETAPSPQIETPAPLPSPAILEAVNAAQSRLGNITTGIEGTRVGFVDCSATSTCTSRLEAQSLTGLRDLLQAVSKDQGGIGFVAREQLDAYTGQKFVADVTLGGGTTRPVPADENELLVNNNGQ